MNGYEIPFKMKEAREATSYQKDDDKHFLQPLLRAFPDKKIC